MAMSSYPFDGQLISENEFSQMFKHFQETGVVPSGLQVSADSSGMNVRVTKGDAFVRGHFFTSSATETLVIGESSSSSRIDVVLLRLDTNENAITLVCKQGTPAASPKAPELEVSETGVYELALANVAVGANAVTIAPGNVTDRRIWTSANLRRNVESGAVEYVAADGTEALARVSSTRSGTTFHIQDDAPIDSLGEDGDVCFEF